MNEVRRKRICLDLSVQKAKEIRDLNRKEDNSIPYNLPSKLEWKDFGNLGKGFIVPDKGFTKQLHMLDEELEVAWDWGSCKWEIWRFPKDGKDEPYHVMTVQTKDRSYRELGADILLQLQRIRSEKFSAGKLIKYLEELDNQDRRRRMKDFKNRIKDIAHDSFINIHCKIIQVPNKYAIERVVRV